MLEARVYLAKGAPLRKQNSAAERRKEMNSVRIMSKKDREGEKKEKDLTGQGFDNRRSDGEDAVVKAV